MKPVQKYRLYEKNELIARGNLREIERSTDLSYYSLGLLRDGKKNKKRPSLNLEPVLVDYACYRGDEFKMIGTLEQVARYLGVTTRIVILYSTDSYRERSSDGTVRVVRLEEDEE